MNILFTNDLEILSRPVGFTIKVGETTYTIDSVRPALGDGAFQIDALTTRQEDGAAIIKASLPRFTEVEGRVLNAYCTLRLAEFPPSLKPYVGHYKGQTRTLRNPEDNSIIARNGSAVKGHVWHFWENHGVSSIQLREGFVVCSVAKPRLSYYQPKDDSSPRNYTLDFTFKVSPCSTFGPWTRPLTHEVTDTKVEEDFVFDVDSKGVKPTKGRRSTKSSALF